MHLQVQPPPAPHLLETHYHDGFGNQENLSTLSSLLNNRKKVKEEYPLKILKELKASSDSFILDVGCSFGYDLYDLRQRGYSNVYGLELSSKAIELGKKILNVSIFQSIQQIKEKNLSFDFIYLKHNLEHHPYPLQTLKELEKIAKPKAFLLIGVPNRKSLNGLLGTRWEWMTPPTHLHFFSKKSISTLLNQTQFKLEKVSYQKGHAMPFLRHLVYFLPKVSFVIRKTMGGPYENKVVKNVFDSILDILGFPFKFIGSFMRKKWELGEELWVLAQGPFNPLKT